jgi:hypothetical protein
MRLEFCVGPNPLLSIELIYELQLHEIIFAPPPASKIVSDVSRDPDIGLRTSRIVKW